jgi:hypothetical protein
MVSISKNRSVLFFISPVVTTDVIEIPQGEYFKPKEMNLFSFRSRRIIAELWNDNVENVKGLIGLMANLHDSPGVTNTTIWETSQFCSF